MSFALVVAFLWSALPLTGIAGVGDTATVRVTWLTWVWGFALSVLAAVLLLALSRGRAADWPYRAAGAMSRVSESRWSALFAGLLGALSVTACLALFDGNPRNVDGFAQLFQARIFLTGRLWADLPPETANFAVLQMVMDGERWYAQYPFGQSLVLAAGLGAGAWWILNPVFAALLSVSTYRVARWCAGADAARLAAVLLCLSPFVVAVAGSEMSHLPAAALGVASAWAATATGGRRPAAAAAAAGLTLGIMTAFRPVDAIAAAATAGMIMLLTAPRPGAWAALILCGGAATLPTLWFNSLTTGSWLEFGYSRLWGPDHSLGFHPTPWGVPLTPLRAAALTGLDLHQLNRDLFDLPLPLLGVMAAGVIAGRRAVTRHDAVPLVAAASLSAILFFWFHRDTFYGPRFIFSAAPWWIIMAARAVTLPAAAGVAPRGARAAVLLLAVSLALGLVAIAPGRLGAYRASTPAFSLHPDRDARRARISNAVVLIRDGWGERLIVRMWALGVPVWRSTRLYSAIDACTLEQALARAEADPTARAALPGTLDSLAALERPGFRSGLASDPNLRLPPADSLPPRCRREIDADRQGTLRFAPFLYLNNASLDGDIVWARDLGDLNGPLFQRYRGRSFFRYAPAADGAAPAFVPVEPAP